MVSWDTRRLSSSGYWVFNHPETCSGDQSRISLLATIFRNFTWIETRHLAISRIDEPETIPREISSRSRCVSARSERPGPPEQTHRDATPDNEWTNAPCRRRARSHATTVPPSNDATCRSSAPPKAQTVSLGSLTPPLKTALYQMVLHRPFEPARLIRNNARRRLT